MADPAKEPSNWTEHTQSDGRRYYYNKVNKLSSWEKPECLKNPDEKLNTTVWKEPPRWQVMLLGRRSKVKLARAGEGEGAKAGGLHDECGGVRESMRRQTPRPRAELHDWRLFQGDEKADIRSLICQLGFLEPEQESPSTGRVYLRRIAYWPLVLLRMLCVDSAGVDA
ncbi:unnamed protein product [Effrenium voratum]|uniref:WW domain-containing protein n=1 Tax=Effrenium voratum TaxID=2562239 RepID=A0AA36NA29_9DINO|nr:unnamed protein product [Effrenium voratum]